MTLLIVFTILGLIVLWSFFFSKKKYVLARLLLAIWLFSIGLAQLRLSPLEDVWTMSFWGLLAFFFVLFFISHRYFLKYFKKKIKGNRNDIKTNGKWSFWVLLTMTVFSVIANLYIYSRFGTLPILSTIPDKMRFIINDEVFGVWEYLALLPRIYIPVTFVVLLLSKIESRVYKLFIWLNILFGFVILSFYASRLIIIIALLMCFFAYLIIRRKEINFTKTILSGLTVAIAVLAISVAIPMFRQSITYRDYYGADRKDAFNYILDISKLNIPEKYGWITPLYIAPTFNLQTLMKSTEYYKIGDYELGQYNLSVFSSAFRIVGVELTDVEPQWKQIFLPWWITATFLQSYWVDYGIVGIVIAAIFWGALLAGIYAWAIKRSSAIAVLMFAYFSFVVIMSVYTNYFLRPELFLDLILISVVGWMLQKK
jgi:oligosaccharide repeat unit polymerase